MTRNCIAFVKTTLQNSVMIKKLEFVKRNHMVCKFYYLIHVYVFCLKGMVLSLDINEALALGAFHSETFKIGFYSQTKYDGDTKGEDLG